MRVWKRRPVVDTLGHWSHGPSVVFETLELYIYIYMFLFTAAIIPPVRFDSRIEYRIEYIYKEI